MRLALTLPLLALATPVLAQTAAFDGDWATGDARACVRGMDATNLAFHIGQGRMDFYESSCALTNPVALRGMEATLYDMACTGEGETWGYRALFMLDHEGALIFVQNGSARVLPRCIGLVNDGTMSTPPAPVK